MASKYGNFNRNKYEFCFSWYIDLLRLEPVPLLEKFYYIKVLHVLYHVNQKQYIASCDY